jgi:signal transduction histidine kinase
VSGDDALLERLVDNLVDNAARYAAPDSVVRVTVSADSDRQVNLRVASEGDVIAAEEVPRLFERFYRRETSRNRRTGGSGLGLAIVSAVAEAHGGGVSAEAPAGGGLVISVVLPHTPAPAQVGGAVTS